MEEKKGRWNKGGATSSIKGNVYFRKLVNEIEQCPHIDRYALPRSKPYLAPNYCENCPQWNECNQLFNSICDNKTSTLRKYLVVSQRLAEIIKEAGNAS